MPPMTILQRQSRITANNQTSKRFDFREQPLTQALSDSSLVEQHCLRFAIVQNGYQLVAFGCPPQGHKYCIRLQNPENANNLLDAIAQIDRHAVPALNALLPEGVSQTIRHRIQFRIGKTPTPAHKSGFVRTRIRAVLEEILN